MKSRKLSIAIAILLPGAISPALAQEDAAALYAQAAKLITVDSPSSSNIQIPAYPPMGPAWDRLSENAWKTNAEARRLAHQAGLSTTIHWPTPAHYLNSTRSIANELSDAALYQHFHNNDADACDFIVDVLHLAALVRSPQDKKPALVINNLVACGIEAVAANRMLVIASNIRLTTDPANKTDLPVSTAHSLIDLFLVQTPPHDQIGEFLNPDGSPSTDPKLAVPMVHVIEGFNRVNAEKTFAALSLACHIYLLEKHHWPDSLDDLVPACIAKVPTDPWGNGKQTFGYTNIQAGLPDGSDRPLVYSHSNSSHNLFYRTDEPEYGFYTGNRATSAGGQFRDVASWIPTSPSNGPTTRPLE